MVSGTNPTNDSRAAGAPDAPIIIGAGHTPGDYQPNHSEASAAHFRSREGASLGWARSLCTERIVQWTADLQRAGLTDFEIVPRGSINNGHYVGPKARDTSWSAAVPRDMEKLIEVDLRIILSASQDPTSPGLIGLIRKSLGIAAKIEENCVWDGVTEWDTKAPCSYLYKYEPFSPLPNAGIGIEWEIGIYRNPLCPIDQYWGKVFSAEEIIWQTAQRRYLMENAATYGVDYKTDFWEVKRQQCRVGVQRLVGVMALFHEARSMGAEATALLDEHRTAVLDIIGIRPPHMHIVKPRIEQWLQGQETTTHAPHLPAVSCLLTPSDATPDSVKRALDAATLQGVLLTSPPDPSPLFAGLERIRTKLIERSWGSSH